jgi:uncharacterized RDD family membrane protein YckC
LLEEKTSILNNYMSSRVERAVPVKRYKTERIIVDFDAERLKAPFLLRCGAILIDYILLVCPLAICFLLGKAFNDANDRDGANLLNSTLIDAGWLIMILLALTNFVIFPLFTGKSLGKMLTGLRIVKTDGNSPSLASLLIRHLIGYPLTVLTFGLGFLFSVFNRRGRALQDFLAGTVVVYGRRKIQDSRFKIQDSGFKIQD